MKMMADENEQDIVCPILLTTDLVLMLMGAIEIAPHFTAKFIDAKKLWSLNKEELLEILPTDTDRAKFVEKYIKFMVDNKLPLDQSFDSEDTPMECPNFELVLMNNDVSPETIQDGSHQNGDKASDEDELEVSEEALVNHLAVGANRKTARQSQEAVDQLDLERLLRSDPLSEAIVDSYKTTKALENKDRVTIARIIVSWLVKQTMYPKASHFVPLTEKVCALFESEEASTWYVASDSGSGKRYARGKLADKVKNYKTALRRKSAEPPKKRRKMSKPQPETVQATAAESTSVQWLKRNFEPPEEVRAHWEKCAPARLKELHETTLTPHEYVEKWNDLLKLPMSFQLVLDDFEKLVDVNANYECLKNTSDNLLMEWPQFQSKVIELLKQKGCGLEEKDRQDFLSLLSSSQSENDKDYITLQVLPYLCKQRGRVKVGKVTLKPTVVESKSAFILHVAGGSEFEKALVDRKARHQKLGAPVQPYVLVQGETKGVARAAYVILNGIPWKSSSVLNAVDVCFKTCFVLNCGFPPEALHLWLLIQKCLYKFNYVGDRAIGTVTEFIRKLQAISVHAP